MSDGTFAKFAPEMARYFSFKKLLITLFSLFLIIQCFRIDTANPAVVRGMDISEIKPVPPSIEVAAILKKACYDCHSNTTVYPWYSQIAPVSWWLQNHIHNGRKRLNFSIWNTYPAAKKDKKLAEAVDIVLEGEMPLNSYTWMHKSARLTAAERKLLSDFFRSLRNFESEKE